MRRLSPEPGSEFFDLNQVVDLVDHAADLGRVLQFDAVVHAPQTEAANRIAMLADLAVGAADKRHAQLCRFLLSHDFPGSPLRSCRAWPRQIPGKPCAPGP